MHLPSASTKFSGLQKGLDGVIPENWTLILEWLGEVMIQTQFPLGLFIITSVPRTDTFNTGASFVNTKSPPHVVTVNKKQTIWRRDVGNARTAVNYNDVTDVTNHLIGNLIIIKLPEHFLKSIGPPSWNYEADYINEPAIVIQVTEARVCNFEMYYVCELQSSDKQVCTLRHIQRRKG